ncbi:MAG: polymerase subunit gamma and tau [Gammaproteobacteria bacterium]|jgi:DNA polymerase-3 subunit gamma/tau|nr:polymerase subunit gamma and tau [Gammaproteobacteria bacterium]
MRTQKIMAHQVLARKWRPQQFKDLIGQTHVIQALTHGLVHNRLHHAYLFTGTRGVGKTTIARIISKCLNCEKGISATPCGQCPTCVDIENGRFVDLIEIDAASKTKVEDTREVLDNVMYAPIRGRYKIYLIDEVHMLSGHSFNALLKTLEEPPEHVIFLLATTDPQKLPITVLSRCLQFQLKALTPEQITPHLAHVLQQEHVKFDPDALHLIAQAAHGSMRDALSLLDQAIATGNGEVSQASTSNMLGFQGQQLILPLAQAILTQDIPQALTISKKLDEVAADFNYILDELIALFHDISIKQLAPDFIISKLIVSDADCKKLVQLCTPADLQLFYQIALYAKRDLPLAPTRSIGFEMALLRMIAFRVESHTTGVETKANSTAITQPSAPIIEKRFEATAAPVIKTEAPQANISSPPPPAVGASSLQNKPASDSWHDILPHLGLTAFAKALADHLHFERREADHFYFSLEEKNAPMLQERHRQKIADALTQYFKSPINMSVQIGRSQHSQNSALEQRQDTLNKKQETALNNFKEDKNLQKVLANFDGKMMPETLTVE